MQYLFGDKIKILLEKNVRPFYKYFSNTLLKVNGYSTCNFQTFYHFFTSNVLDSILISYFSDIFLIFLGHLTNIFRRFYQFLRDISWTFLPIDQPFFWILAIYFAKCSHGHFTNRTFLKIVKTFLWTLFGHFAIVFWTLIFFEDFSEFYKYTSKRFSDI